MKRYVAFLFILVFILGKEPVSAQKHKPLYTAPLGVQAYTFRKSFPIDVAKTLDTIKMMGFTEIESRSQGMSPEAFKKLCNDRGISIPSTEANYDQLEKSPESLAHAAKLMGAKYLMCAWVPHKGRVFTFENAKSTVEVFNKAGKVLKDSGIVFCYHAHGYEFQSYQNGTLLDYLIQNTNPKYVSFEMDIFWMQFGGGDPVLLLKKYGKRWKLMHLKDMRKGTVKNLTGGTSTDNDVSLGTGEIDIPGILKEAKKIGIKHYFIEDESNFVSEHVPQSVAYLKSLSE
ncbi:MAG: sugar phosphate isomerase/epimerase [Bacteroidota bacterium]|nr:sugar phosphate isomerase/epimerase [Bacteroidota bacterium]